MIKVFYELEDVLTCFEQKQRYFGHFHQMNWPGAAWSRQLRRIP